MIYYINVIYYMYMICMRIHIDSYILCDLLSHVSSNNYRSSSTSTGGQLFFFNFPIKTWMAKVWTTGWYTGIGNPMVLSRIGLGKIDGEPKSICLSDRKTMENTHGFRKIESPDGFFSVDVGFFGINSGMKQRRNKSPRVVFYRPLLWPKYTQRNW